MSMAKRKPKHSDSDRDYPQTTFDAQGQPVLPPPQFIGKMPQQLAAYSDNVNVKGLPAKGGVAVGWHETKRNIPLTFRGVKNVYIKPSFLAEENYFSYDADSAYRQEANKTIKDFYSTNHQSLNNMYRGIVGAADILSKYFGKPFRVLPFDKRWANPNTTSPDQPNFRKDQIDVGLANIPSKIGPRDLVIDVTGKTDHGALAEGLHGMYRRDSYISGVGHHRDKPALAIQHINARATGGSPEDWTGIFMHEFGHNLGAKHPHEYRQGTSLNSIMSYDSKWPTGRWLPADINYFRDTMGYNMTPQSIRQRIDSTGSILPNAPQVTPTTGFPTPSFLAAPLPKKKNNRGNKKGR